MADRPARFADVEELEEFMTRPSAELVRDLAGVDEILVLGVGGKMGPTLARMLYGATLANGLADFARAFAAVPDSLVLQYQYALALAAYDRNLYRDAIANALTKAAAGAPNTAYESFAQTNARELLATWRSGDMQSFDHLVRHDQGYP